MSATPNVSLEPSPIDGSDAEQLGSPGGLAEQHLREDGVEDRGAAVEEPGDGRGDVLLRDREQSEGNGHPDHRHRDQAEAVLGADLGVLAWEREDGEGQRAEADAHQRDHAGCECIEPDVDEQERRAPDDGDREEQAPIGRGELVVDRGGGRRYAGHSGTVPG